MWLRPYGILPLLNPRYPDAAAAVIKSTGGVSFDSRDDPNPAKPEPNIGWRKNLRRLVEDFTGKRPWFWSTELGWALALGSRQIEQGKVTPARSALMKVRERRKRRP